MKYRNRIGIVFLLIMLGGLVALLYLTQPKEREKRDMVAYNDEICRIYEAYLSGTPVETLEEKFECTIAVGKGAEAKIMRGYAEYALVMDFAPEGDVIGKIVWNDVDREAGEASTAFRRQALILWGILLAAGLVLLVVIDHFLLRPVRDMQGMVGEIAKGNLDVPLPIRKHNPFDGLVEGFDLMREELRASREREIEAEKAKKELVAELAHDIKTPVASIKSASEFGYELAKDEKVKERFNLINFKADELTVLVDNLFQSSVHEATEITVSPRENDSSSVQEAILHADYLKRAGDFTIPECRVFTDKLRLQQAFDNVFINSYKYADTEIKVDAKLEGEYLKVAIRDFGPGVTDEEVAVLKEKYKRGKNSEGKDGAGIGLYLASYFLKEMDGDILITNEEPGLQVLFLIRTV